MQGKKLIATLLVHLRTQQQYEEENQASLQKKVSEWQTTMGGLAEWLESEQGKGLIAHWWWPPWRFNDIVGFVEIVYDGGTRLMSIGHLPRKRISRQLKHKTFYHYGVPGYGKITDVHMMRPFTEKIVREALSELLSDTDQWFSERGLHLECDHYWFECLDVKTLIDA